ncbi:MAG: P-loop NTPase [Balneolaceae bacterium]
MTTRVELQIQPFVLSVLSGKGGVGKSLTSVNVAVTLAGMGYNVVLVDADPGFSNCATLLNAPVEYSVADWLAGHCSPEECIQTVGSIRLITAADDPAESRRSVDPLLDGLDRLLHHVAVDADWIIMDTPAGASEITYWALDQSHLGVLMLVDEPASISDVYRLCKHIYRIDPGYPFATIVNRSENVDSGADTRQRFNTVLNYFLKKELPGLGILPESDTIQRAIQTQRPLQSVDPDGPEQREFEFIAENLIGRAGRVPSVGIPVSTPDETTR